MQSGGLLERPRRGSPASSLRAARPARPGPALPGSGRPRATGPVRSPALRRRPGCGARKGRSGRGRASEAAPGRRGLRAREAERAVPTCPGPPRPPCAFPGAARGRGSRRACLRAACPAGGTERRRGGPDPAPRPRRASFSAARWAPLSQSRARPAAQNRVAELCARFGVGVDGGPGCRPPRARLYACSCGRFGSPFGSLRHALY